MIGVLIIFGLLAGFGYFAWKKRMARKALLASALSAHQRRIIAHQVPITRRLPKGLRAALEGKIQLFLDQIDFIGCDDLDVTEEMRLSIAAQACLLVVNTKAWYRDLRTILVYPGAYKSQAKRRNGYVVTENEAVRLGESWARGPVVLSWEAAEFGAQNDRDGHNVVFHEFAHQLDNLSGQTDGAPILDWNQSSAEWARIFKAAYAKHMRDVSSGRATVIDNYGATGPEEFFAVVVELFFERPQALRLAEPEIYVQLATYFDLDPLSW